MKATLVLNGLHCAHCAEKIEKAVNKLKGVESASLNFMTTKLFIEAPEALMEGIVTSAAEVTKKIEPELDIKRI